MAINLNNLEATKTRWQAPSLNYPTGSFINGTGQGRRDGSYCKAEWANEIFGFLGSLLNEAEISLNNQPETAQNSQYRDALKKIIQTAIETLGGDPTATAGGTGDAITATFTKPVFLENGERVLVRATTANTSTTPTFQPTGLDAKTIVKGDNQPLQAGDIAGAGFWADLIYDATLDKWVLQNPATGTEIPSASESQSGTIQIATNADVQTGTNNTKAVSPLRAFANFVSVNAQTLSETLQTQVLTNLGVIQALEELITENGGTVPTSLTENSVQTMSAQSDPWAEYD